MLSIGVPQDTSSLPLHLSDVRVPAAHAEVLLILSLTCTTWLPVSGEMSVMQATAEGRSTPPQTCGCMPCKCYRCNVLTVSQSLAALIGPARLLPLWCATFRSRYKKGSNPAEPDTLSVHLTPIWNLTASKACFGKT